MVLGLGQAQRMIALTALIVLAMAIAGLYQLMRRQPDRRSLWRMALYVGTGTGLVRAAFASIGWYVIERDSGAMQIPALAFVMMAWPEAAVFAERRLVPAPPAFYVELSLLLVATTLAVACVVAAIAAGAHVGRARM
jgi:hypothetical protein